MPEYGDKMIFKHCHPIGILSDTHGLLRQEVIDAFKGVDHIIHAGDIDNKSVINRLEEIATVTVVRGNVDKECLRW